MMSSTQLCSSELALLDQPQAILNDPEPHTKRSQQVRRLEQHGLYKIADAVKACGRLGEKWGYECGRSYLHKIILSHRRFCCLWCDRHVAARLFEEHRAYSERLHPSGTLHRVTVRSGHYSLSSDGVRDFEEALVEAVRRWFKGCQGWGFKFLTHYEDGCLVAKGIIYLAPGASLPLNGLPIPFGTCTVGRGVSVTAFEAMLADVLQPSLTEDHGVLRADLMVAFHKGKHFRSLGVFYGLTSNKRAEKRLERNQEKLHLIAPPQSGATFVEAQDISAPLESETTLVKAQDLSPYVPPCPHCGPGCKRVSVSVEPMSDLQDIQRFEENTSTETAWGEMQRLLRRRYVF